MELQIHFVFSLGNLNIWSNSNEKNKFLRNKVNFVIDMNQAGLWRVWED